MKPLYWRELQAADLSKVTLVDVRTPLYPTICAPSNFPFTGEKVILMDKRIDEFSQVIKHNGTVYDLMALEQAYAPPFSSAKDPVAVAG